MYTEVKYPVPRILAHSLQTTRNWAAGTVYENVYAPESALVFSRLSAGLGSRLDRVSAAVERPGPSDLQLL